MCRCGSSKRAATHSVRDSVLGLKNLCGSGGKEKFELWLFHGNGKHSSFSVSKNQLFTICSACSCLLLLSIAVTGYHCWDWYASSEQQNIAELKEYLQQKKVDDAQGQVNAKMKHLTDEFSRFKHYEQQVKGKVAALDAVLKDALQLDSKYAETGGEKPKREARRFKTKRSLFIRRGENNENSDTDDGIGGGDSVRSRKSALSPSLTQRLFSPNPKTDLSELLDAHLEKLTAIPIGVPTTGHATSGYGYRWMPGAGMQFHEGLDFAVNQKTRVVGTADGTVVHAGWSGAYGKLVVIDHGNGVETAYGHLSKIAVKAGDKVCRGQQIGNVGSTGRSTGPHVHYEVRVAGVPKDPQPFVDLASALSRLQQS